MTMTIATERGVTAPRSLIEEKPKHRPVRKLRWLIIVGLLLTLLVGGLIGPVFAASIESAVAAGDAVRIGSDPLNLFWFAHHTVLMMALVRLPATPCLDYARANDLERQACEFILRGIGLNAAAIAAHLDRELPPELSAPARESA